MRLHWKGEEIELNEHKALFFAHHRALVMADLHLGKINHFRKAGIAVPTRANDHNSERLIQLIQSYRPERVIFLGDLFHSHYNEEWEVLGQIRKHFLSTSFELVRGNHDILSERQYERWDISVHSSLSLGTWCLTHDPAEQPAAGEYQLSGHVHPGVRLAGAGKQSLVLPCFWLGQQQGLIPAFGSFTGLAKIVPRKGDKVFVVTENKVMELMPEPTPA